MIRKILLSLAIVVALYVIAAYVQGYFWSRDAARYMEATLVAIAKPWSVQRIEERASLALKASGTERLAKTVETANTILGNLVKLTESPTCKLITAIDTYSNKEFMYATCLGKVEFERKTVVINMRLVQQSKEWRLDDFNIER